MYKLIEEHYELKTGFKIFKNLCSCLTCRLNIKLIGFFVSKDECFGSSISITHSKVFNLIKQFGITRVEEKYIKIVTDELIYYIDLI